MNKILIAAGLLLASFGAHAGLVSVDGITFDEDERILKAGNIFIDGITNQTGTGTRYNRGVGRVNTISTDSSGVITWNTGGPVELNFVFDNYNETFNDGVDYLNNGGTVSFYVNTPGTFAPLSNDFVVDSDRIDDGILWLQLTGHAINGATIDGEFVNGSQNDGAGFLDVVGGSAADWFDTNEMVDGSDLDFGFKTFTRQGGYNWSGVASLTAKTAIPEPTTMALLGLGLIGIGFKTRNKKV